MKKFKKIKYFEVKGREVNYLHDLHFTTDPIIVEIARLKAKKSSIQVNMVSDKKKEYIALRDTIIECYTELLSLKVR